MSYESIDVYVLDDTALHAPVEGMLVRVFGPDNVTFHTQGTTDVDGHVGFTLWTQEYNLRFFKFETQVVQPQVIDVVEGATNSFNAYATVFVHPLANDPRLCRCSGYFRDVTGAPLPWMELYVISNFNPILLEGAAVLGERRTVRTNESGYACIDLIRGACYQATLAGMEDVQRQVAVPDLPSANLPDVLFPVVEEITFDVEGPYALSVGVPLVLTPVVVTSSGVPLAGTANADVVWSSSDDSVLSVTADVDTVTLLGKTAGSAELVVTRRDQSIIRIPSTSILGVPQVVNVT
jgi:hypothetical protein